MHIIHSLLMFAVVAAALPSYAQDSYQPRLVGSDGALMTSGQCNRGQHYCFSQIIGDLSMSFTSSVHQIWLTRCRSIEARHSPPVLRSEVHRRLAELQHMQEAASPAA